MCRKLGFLFLLLLFAWGCEKPNSPNFNLQNEIQTPLIMQKEFEFIGGTEALIDTTSEDYDSLFVVSDNGRVNLVKNKDLDIGSLNDAIPVLPDEHRSFGAQVGPIGFSDFATGGEVGRVSFEKVTGLPASSLTEGTPVPAGQSPQPIEVDLNTDNLVQMTVKEGALEIAIDNQLGLDIKQLDLQLLSDGNMVGNQITFNQLQHNTTETATLNFSAGTVLTNLSVQVEISWASQVMQSDAGDIIVKEVKGRDLKASSIQARVPSQQFSRNATISLNTSEFEFRDPQDYVELKSGRLVVKNLSNGLDLGLDTLQISFKSIILPDQNGNYNPSDSLVIDLTENGPISRDSRNTEDVQVDLSGARIMASGNTLDYHIEASTIDSRDTNDPVRTIQEEDSVSAGISLENLKIDRANGFIRPQVVNVTQDDASNGLNQLDVFNNSEAEVVSIDGLNTISSQLEGIKFQNASMTIRYQSNIGIGSRIYASMVGIDARGNRVFLQGKPQGPHYVAEGDSISGLQADGQPLANDQLVRFDINAASSGTETGTVVFSSDNSNINEFLNNLPDEIRFIGKGLINPAQNSGTIRNPVRFDPSISVNVPLSLATPNNPASYRDTVEANMDFLPDKGDDSQIDKAILKIDYENGLPFAFDLKLTFLDSAMQPVVDVPLDTQDPLTMEAAAVDKAGYVSGASDGSMVVQLTSDQMDALRNAKHMILQTEFNTTGNEVVNVRSTDALSIRIGAEITTQTEVN